MGIGLKKVGRRFGDQAALRDVSATIDDGPMVAVLGANGAGKSTLLRLLAGWLPVSGGRIEVGGNRMGPNQISVRHRVLLLDEPRPHDGSVINSISQVILEFGVHYDGIENDVADWMERLDLVDAYNKKSRSVSKGQRYKVAMIGLPLGLSGGYANNGRCE